jgi:hypothetical protein
MKATVTHTSTSHHTAYIAVGDGRGGGKRIWSDGGDSNGRIVKRQ